MGRRILVLSTRPRTHNLLRERDILTSLDLDWDTIIDLNVRGIVA